MKLYLNLLIFATLFIAFKQVAFIDTAVIQDRIDSKITNEIKISSGCEKFATSPFNNRYLYGNENQINTVEVNFVIAKDKITLNNHHVLFNKYKIYLQNNILAYNNNYSYYKKLFHKLRILQI
jgi:hypothetical protein